MRDQKLVPGKPSLFLQNWQTSSFSDPESCILIYPLSVLAMEKFQVKSNLNPSHNVNAYLLSPLFLSYFPLYMCLFRKRAEWR